MKRILVLFPNNWDRDELRREKYRGRYQFLFEGWNFFKFPGWLRLFAFRADRYLDALARRYRKARLHGVISTDDYLGAAVAAALARKLDLPGGDPEAIITAQHKYFSRRRQREVAPEAVPEFALVPVFAGQRAGRRLPFPFFVKPCKGTFSLFAARVDDEPALARHLAFSRRERFLLRRMVAPFNDLVRAYTALDRDAGWFLAEELIDGVQVTLDGFACRGEVQVLGVVDSVMFPGTSTFARFEYPSRAVSPGVQARMADIAGRVVRGLGIRHGLFNIEFFYDDKSDALKVIEINPRLSYQFADLYENVDGHNPYDVLIDLALGRRPAFAGRGGKHPVAASFVLRTFAGKRLVQIPSPADVAAFSRRHDDSRLRIYGKKGQSLASEMRAIGSYRYATVNAGGGSLVDLFAIYQDALARLPFRFD